MRLTLAVTMVALVAAPVQAQTFEFERTLAAGAAQLEVTTEQGQIAVRAGTSTGVVVRGRAAVRVGFNVPADAVALARAVAATPPIETSADVIRLRLPGDDRTRQGVTIAWEVVVPVGMRVTTVSDSGETTIAGIAGAVSATTQSARVRLSQLGGDATVDTGSGDVTADGVSGTFAVTTSSSGITATGLGGDLRVRTGSGQVQAAFTGAGDADVETQSSRITLENLRGGLRAVTESGQVRVDGAPARNWSIETGSSRIQVSLPAAAAFTLDATSGSSSVTTDNLMVRGETSKGRVAGPVDGGGPVITLRSRSGAIRIDRRGAR